jgi:hypothetical protein
MGCFWVMAPLSHIDRATVPISSISRSLGATASSLEKQESDQIDQIKCRSSPWHD